MKTTSIDRWEDIVYALDQNETKSVVESPAWMAEEVSQDLWHPKEAKDADLVDIFSHNPRWENDQREGDEKDGDN